MQTADAALLNFNPVRQENESFEDYKLRQKSIKVAQKTQKQGVLVWDSWTQGTYRKTK